MIFKNRAGENWIYITIILQCSSHMYVYKGTFHVRDIERRFHSPYPVLTSISRVRPYRDWNWRAKLMSTCGRLGLTLWFARYLFNYSKCLLSCSPWTVIYFYRLLGYLTFQLLQISFFKLSKVIYLSDIVGPRTSFFFLKVFVCRLSDKRCDTNDEHVHNVLLYNTFHFNL